MSNPHPSPKGQFKKGQSGNPGGGPKGRRTALVEMDEAIREFQKEHGINYWKATTILAMKLAREDKNTTLLCKVMDKFLPSKSSISSEDASGNSVPLVVYMPEVKESAT